MTEVLKVIRSGPSLSFQDTGRIGMGKFGVPISGPMDPECAALARHLLFRPPGELVLEIGFGGSLLEVTVDAWMAHFGGLHCPTLPSGSARLIKAGTKLEFAPGEAMWSYLSIDGEFKAPAFLGSSSQAITGTETSSISASLKHSISPAISGRFLSPAHDKEWDRNPVVNLHRGPHTAHFKHSDLAYFSQSNWTVSSLSNRFGYRLDGGRLNSPLEIDSIPIFPGCIQIPPSGNPIVVLHDGPTVGGYPIIGVVDSCDLSKLTQRRPGQSLHFNWHE